MSTPAVDRLCRYVWQAREQGTLTRDDVRLSRAIYAAAAVDIQDCGDVRYDPEMDRRIDWLREVARQVRMLRPGLKPLADEPLEDLMEWMLFREHRRAPRRPCGKDMAAGG